MCIRYVVYLKVQPYLILTVFLSYNHNIDISFEHILTYFVYFFNFYIDLSFAVILSYILTDMPFFWGGDFLF